MYYNENTIVYVSGKYCKAADASTSLYDQSIHYGYAAFEGIRSYETENGTRIFKAIEHFQRLQYSCESVGIPYAFDNEVLIDVCYQLLDKNNLSNAYIRPLVSCPANMSLTKARSSNLFIAVWEWGAYLGERLLRLSTSPYKRITPASFKVDAKISGHYVNSILATQTAKDSGYDEALMLDIDGFVAEAPGANIFMEKNGVLFTPATGSILPGITRATVIGLCNQFLIPVVQKKITADELKNADSVFLCGTAAEVIGVASLDKVKYRKDWQSSIGAVIQDAYKKLVLGKTEQQQLHVA